MPGSCRRSWHKGLPLNAERWQFDLTESRCSLENFPASLAPESLARFVGNRCIPQRALETHDTRRALSDSDCLPLTSEELSEMERVPGARKKIPRAIEDALAEPKTHRNPRLTKDG